MNHSDVPDDLVERAQKLARSHRRRILGIVGPPGSGKSTLADGIVRKLGPLACRVPMDGFHLANAELLRQGLRDRKGAPETFDALGYVALLERLTRCDDDVVYAPEYHREIEEPVAGAIPVPSSVPLVVTEGNYLLLHHGPWARVRALLDEVWFLSTDEEARLRMLIARHVEFGKEPAAARKWALGPDHRNARLVDTTRHRADMVISVDLERRPPSD